jgi:hypothetical protein
MDTRSSGSGDNDFRVAASGVVVSRMVPLLTAEEIDQALSKNLQLAGLSR